MNKTRIISISSEQQETYAQMGVICLKQLLTADEIALLKQGIDYNLSNLSKLKKLASDPNDPGAFIEDFCTWQTNPYYQQFIFDSPLASVAASLMQSQTVRVYHDHLLVKEAGTQQPTPWHQDQPYYNINGLQNGSYWIPIDPIKQNASLEFIAGSHLGPWLMPRSFLKQEAKWFPEGSLAELPDIEAEREKYPLLSWEMNPGDVIFFHMLTLHAAPGVKMQNRRRVLSLRFIGDDITLAPRPWVTSPPFEGIEQILVAGDTLNHPLFPIVWPPH